MVTILSKILENTVSEQVGGYLEDNSLLHLHQGAIDVEEVQKMSYCIQLISLFTLWKLAILYVQHFWRPVFDSPDHFVVLNCLI